LLPSGMEAISPTRMPPSLRASRHFFWNHIFSNRNKNITMLQFRPSIILIDWGLIVCRQYRQFMQVLIQFTICLKGTRIWPSSLCSSRSKQAVKLVDALSANDEGLAILYDPEGFDAVVGVTMLCLVLLLSLKYLSSLSVSKMNEALPPFHGSGKRLRTARGTCTRNVCTSETFLKREQSIVLLRS
jgi:hypothetical protein